MWERAVGEKLSSDSEREWFGEITLANIAPYLPLQERFKRINSLRLDGFRFQQAASVLALEKSLVGTGEDRFNLQKLAWSLGKSYWESPAHSSSEDGAALKWSGTPDEKRKWLDDLVSKFDPNVVWSIWQEAFEDAQTDEEFDGHSKRKFFGQVTVLARFITPDKTLPACQSCWNLIEVHESLVLFNLGQLSFVISRLISVHASDEQNSIWQAIFHDLLSSSIGSSSAGWNWELFLAGFLIRDVPDDNTAINLYRKFFETVERR
ncbi:MAG: hypothetical protein KF893_09620 [Caldilineaceae bacterium]|nr:hypothetical protein [Caldilineaceae bacterium]